MNVVELTKKLVSIDSTDPGKYEFSIENYIKSYLDDLKIYGAKVYESEVINGRKNVMAVLSHDDDIKADTISDEVILICHMDTVVIGNDWTKDAFDNVIIDDKIYGRGSADMKSGLAVALSVFEYICKNYDRNRLKKNFKIIFTVDEEADMRGVEVAIKDGWVNKSSFVCDLEPTDKTIQVSHKGRFWIKLTVKGKTAHASRPELGIDANACIAEIISFIRKQIDNLPKDDELGKTSVTFGMLSGGYQPYVVPDNAIVTMDFRLTPPTFSKNILDIIQDSIHYAKEIFSDEVKINYEITGDRAFVKRDDDSEFLRVMYKTLEELYENEKNDDYKPVVTYFSGYTDTAVIASTLSNRNIFSYGPGSLDMAHKPDEYVNISDILRCEKVYKKLLENILIN